MNNVDLVCILGPAIWLIAIVVVITPIPLIQMLLVLMQLIIFGIIIMIDLRR